jgi:hypothetical protein
MKIMTEEEKELLLSLLKKADKADETSLAGTLLVPQTGHLLIMVVLD